ncbi:MAG: hypothetical protein K1X77_01645 [Bacteroidia bacterium]|jgi:methylmalonyl-CoA mutase|nr:hypothetical protein [Bacteroidia bacterium]
MGLFTEFKKATYSEWREQLQKELKGTDDARFTHRSIEGIKIPTYISPDTFSSSESPVAYRSNNANQTEGANSWLACVEIDTANLFTANKTALALLEQGAGAVRFKGIGISNQEELRLVLKDINPALIRIHFDAGEANPSLLFMLYDELLQMQQEAHQIQGSLAFDPLSDYAFNGYLHTSFDETMQIAKALLDFRQVNLPAFHIFSIQGARWHNAGASTALELAIALACATEYGVQLKVPEQVLPAISVQIAAGADYFASIAKFRSFRMLWAKMLQGFGLDARTLPLWLAAETSQRNKTIFDPWNNQLRLTTEAMAAVIAGADELTIHPYDQVFRASDELAQRTALNVHHLLRYESHLNAVADAASGSMFIETLTSGITEKAWALFLEIEKQGGYLKALRKGWIQQAIMTSRQELEQNFRTGKRSLIGTNRFAQIADAGHPFKILAADPLRKEPEFKPIDTFREAELIEQIRLNFTGSQKPAHVFLAMTSNSKRANDRAEFITDFMAMAGISCIGANSEETLAQQLQSTKARTALAIVLCGADEEYLPAWEALDKNLLRGTKVLVAGRPDTTDQLSASGIADYIYLGCDALPIFFSLSKTD